MHRNGNLIGDLEKRFLLGELAKDERLALEQRLIADGDLFDRMRAAERELADAYAAGELSTDDAKRFETRYLATPEGRRLGDFALALRAAGAEKPRPVAPPVNVHRFPRRAVWLGLAAAVAALLFGLWHLSERFRPGGRETPAIASVVLPLRVVRSEAEPRRIEIPAGVDRIELVLDLEGVAAEAPFAVEIRDVTASLVWEAGGLEAVDQDWGPSLVVRLPASRLPAGEYELRARGSGIDGGIEDAWVRLAVHLS